MTSKINQVLNFTLSKVIHTSSPQTELRMGVWCPFHWFGYIYIFHLLKIPKGLENLTLMQFQEDFKIVPT